MGASCTKAGREEAAFLKAAKDGDCHVVHQGVTKDVEWAYKVQTWNGQSVFHLAARYGRMDVLETVVEAVRFNPAGPAKWSKLLRMGHSTDALLRTFCNLPDARCQTPLHLACIYGHADLAQRLLELGSTPWAWDELGGRTPLHYAASMGHVDVIRVVVSHSGPQPTGEALRRPNTPRTRLVDICNDSGYTPLHYAVWAGNAASIRALTSYDASLSARNVACGSDWIVSCLKCTPLHLAAHKGNEAVVKLLLSAYVQSQPPQGADAAPITDRRRRDPRRHVNANRQLPYHMAVARNHTRLAEILHPDVPFSFILTPAEMESRLYGVAKLAVIASKILQAKLLSDIESAVSAINAAGQRGGGGGGALAAGRTRSGSVAALSGAVAAAAAAGQAGAAVAAAQQVLAAATARLRAAGERSLGGAASLTGASPEVLGAATATATATAGSVDGVATGRQQSQSRKQSIDQGQGQGRVVGPSRLSHDSGVSPAVPSGAVVNGTVVATPPAPGSVASAATAAAAAAAAAAGKGSAPASGGSSDTSNGDSEREALAVEPVQDLANRTRAASGSPAPEPSSGLQQPQTQMLPLPLPPAPLSPFLPTAAAGGGSGAPAGGNGVATPRPPPTFTDAASAFALFAAEPFAEQAPAGGQMLNHAGSNSISLAVLAHNRAQQQVAAATGADAELSVAATSVSIAALARSRSRGGGGGPEGAGRAAGGASATRGGGNKAAPGRSRSLRKLFTGGRLLRSNTQAGAAGGNPSNRGDPSVAGGAAATEQPSYDGEDGDDLDEILNAMRPSLEATAGTTAEAGTGAAAAAAQAPTAGASDDGGSGAAGPSRSPQPGTAAGASPPAQQKPSRRAGGGLTFWRRTTSQGLPAAVSAQQPTPEGGSSQNGSVHAGPMPGPMPGAALAATPNGGAARGVPSPSPLGPPGTLSLAPSGSLAAALPPGVIEARTSVDAPQTAAAAAPATPPASDADDSSLVAPTGPVSRAESNGVEGLRRRSISLAVLARGGGPSAAPGEDAVAAVRASDVGPGQPAVDGAMLTMLASLVEAPQHVLRRYRLLQLTHGLDLQDLLRDHSEQQQAAGAAAAAAGAAEAAGAVVGTPVRGAADGGGVAAGALADPTGEGPAGAGPRTPGGRPSGASGDDPGVRPGSSTTLGPPGSAALGASAATAGGASPRPAASPFAQAEAAMGALSVPASPGSALARAPTGAGLLPGAVPSGAGHSPLLAPSTSTHAHAAPASLAGHLLRTLSSQAASESGEGMCGVCFDQPDCLRITGCGHRLCADCSRELCKLNTFKPALCPFCRGLIGGFKYVGR